LATRYKYTAVSIDGTKTSGVVEAEDVLAAKSIIDGKGLIPITVEKTSSYAGDLRTMFRRSISHDDLIFMTRKLYTLSRAGIPILRSLDIIIEDAEDKKMIEILTDVRKSIENGSALAEALKKHSGYFPMIFIEAIAAGEESGTLDSMLSRTIELMEREAKVRENIKTAVRYPIFVMITIAIAFLIIVTVVIPKFATLYSGYGAQLPWATRLLIDINHFIREYWVLLLIALPFVALGFWKLRLTDWGKRGYDYTIITAPIISPVFLKATMSRFCHTLATLLSSGLPLSRALAILRNSIGNYYFSKVIVKMGENLSGGRNLVQPMKDSEYFNPLAVQMFSIGLESGSLETLLMEVAAHFDREIEYDTKKLTSKIEPILTVMIAVLVLIMALAIFTPMWNMIEVFKR